MNIFKILAQGDGSINEPNVSAFLGYLLNPNEDHGLGSRFLEPFLQQHYLKARSENNNSNLEWLNKDDSIVDLSTNSNYEINVFFEQAFSSKNKESKENDGKKEVVDIILIVHEVEKQKREKYFENYLRNERKLKHIFLIEVKIYDSAVKLEDGKGKEGQLTEQVKKSKEEITELLKYTKIKIDKDKDISFIFVTPNSKTFEKTRSYKAFKELKNKNTKLQKSIIFWNTINNNDEIEDENEDGIEEINIGIGDSIEKILDNIIKPEPNIKAEPLPLYTTDTIQSFSNFIYSGFSYKPKRPKGNGLTEIYDKNQFDKFKDKYYNIIDKESWNRIINIKDKILELDRTNLTMRHSRTHICSYFYKNKKIFGFSKKSSTTVLNFIYKRNYPINDFLIDIKERFQNLECEYNETKYGVKISNFNKVNDNDIIGMIRYQIEKIKSN